MSRRGDNQVTLMGGVTCGPHMRVWPSFLRAARYWGGAWRPGRKDGMVWRPPGGPQGAGYSGSDDGSHQCHIGDRWILLARLAEQPKTGSDLVARWAWSCFAVAVKFGGRGTRAAGGVDGALGRHRLHWKH
jgi:hypothetical protein